MRLPIPAAVALALGIAACGGERTIVDPRIASSASRENAMITRDGLDRPVTRITVSSDVPEYVRPKLARMLTPTGIETGLHPITFIPAVDTGEVLVFAVNAAGDPELATFAKVGGTTDIGARSTATALVRFAAGDAGILNPHLTDSLAQANPRFPGLLQYIYSAVTNGRGYTESDAISNQAATIAIDVVRKIATRPASVTSRISARAPLGSARMDVIAIGKIVPFTPLPVTAIDAIGLDYLMQNGASIEFSVTAAKAGEVYDEAILPRTEIERVSPGQLLLNGRDGDVTITVGQNAATASHNLTAVTHAIATATFKTSAEYMKSGMDGEEGEALGGALDRLADIPPPTTKTSFSSFVDYVSKSATLKFLDKEVDYALGTHVDYYKAIGRTGSLTFRALTRLAEFSESVGIASAIDLAATFGDAAFVMSDYTQYIDQTVSKGVCQKGGVLTTTLGCDLDLYLLPDPASVAVGGTLKLMPSFRDKSMATVPGPAVTFTSKNPELATVASDGTVKGVAVGTAIIHAVGGLSERDLPVNVVLPMSGPLTNGKSERGSLVVVGQTDRWTFMGKLADLAVLRLAKTSGQSTFVPELKILDPSGKVVADDWESIAAERTITAQATGTFTATVSSRDRTSTGTYEILLLKTPGAYVTIPADEGGLIDGTSTYDGAVGPNDMDMYSIFLKPGQNLCVGMGVVVADRDFVPQIRIVSPSGLVADTRWDSLATQAQVRAQESGEYRIIVESRTAGASGSYRMSIVLAPGGASAPPGGDLLRGRDQVVAIGAGGVHGFRVSLTKGARYVLDMRQLSGDKSFVNWIRVISPSGAPGPSVWNSPAVEATGKADETGVYTFVTSSRTPQASGTYRLQFAAGPDDSVTPYGDAPIPLVNGQNTLGSLDAGAIREYSFTVIKNQPFIVTLGQTAGDPAFVPFLRLISPTGVVTEYWDSGAAQLSVSHAEEGRYVLVVSSRAIAAAGSYRLTLGAAPAGATGVGDEGEALSLGGSNDGALPRGDSDLWSVFRTAGDSLNVSVSNTSGNAAFVVQILLVGPDGQRVGETWDNVRAGIKTKVNATGLYTLFVIARTPSIAGAYTLTSDGGIKPAAAHGSP